MTFDSKNNAYIEQHLLNIEAQLKRLSGSPGAELGSLFVRRDNEVSLREICHVLWGGKWWIVGITLLFAIASVFLALSLPNKYKTETVLAPAQEKNGGLGGLAAQFGGLAAMAGLNLGGKTSSDVDQAIALVKSWPFLSSFVERYDLKPLVMAVKEWDSINNKIIYDEKIYNYQEKLWVREPEPNRPSEPTSYEVYQVLLKMISVSQDVKTGLIRLDVEHYVPQVAHEWSRLLVQDINAHFQRRDIQDAMGNIDYLRAKIEETSIAEMQSVFYRMIEAQMKTLMLAEVSNEYLLKTVVPPVLPEMKSGPKRALICIVGLMFGGVLSIGVVLMTHLFKLKKPRL